MTLFLVTFPVLGTGLSMFQGHCQYLILTALRIRTHSVTITAGGPEAWEA